MNKTGIAQEGAELERLVHNALMCLPEDDRGRILAKYAKKYRLPSKASSDQAAQI